LSNAALWQKLSDDDCSCSNLNIHFLLDASLTTGVPANTDHAYAGALLRRKACDPTLLHSPHIPVPLTCLRTKHVQNRSSAHSMQSIQTMPYHGSRLQTLHGMLLRQCH
jgi:hypothetical protein